MREKALVAWNLVVSWILALGIIDLVVSIWISPGEVILLMLPPSVALAAVLAFLTRKDPGRCARFLLVTLMGALCVGAVAIVMVAHWAIDLSDPGWFEWATAVGFAIILLVFVGCHRIPKIAVAVAAVVVLGAGVGISVAVDRQGQEIRRFIEQWRAQGWPVEANQVFPKASTRDRCQAWVDLCAQTEKKENDLDSLYSDVGKLTLNVSDTLASGGDLGSLISTSEVIANSGWQQVEDINARALAASRQCPYLQWFAAEEFADSPYSAPVPKLRAMLKWARGMTIQALHLAAEGRIDEAQNLTLALVNASRLMRVRGQILITTLVSVVMERMAVVSMIGIQSISQQPWPDDIRARIEELADPGLDVALSCIDGARYSIQKLCELSGQDTFGHAVNYIFRLDRYRVPLLAFCKEDLQDHDGILNWLATEPDFGSGDFAWHQARLGLPQYREGRMTPDVLRLYGRLILLVTQWRQVLAVDAVFRHLAESGDLPESCEALQTEWPEDPFDQQPMRYQRLDANAFSVYSIGSDEIDQQGEPLYVNTGFLVVDKPQDIGVRLKIQQAAE